MIRKKLYILIAAILSSLLVTYIAAIKISSGYESKISGQTTKAIYDTIGTSTTRRIDSVLDLLSEEIKGRDSEEQARLIKKFFKPFRIFKFDSFTQIITKHDGTPLHIFSTDYPDISMDMQNKPYREFITRFQRLKKTGGGYEFYSLDHDNAPERLIYVSRIPGTELWHCVDTNLTEYIRTVEGVFTPLETLNSIHIRTIHIITLIVITFILFISIHIGRQITELEKERKEQNRNLQRANELLEIEISIRKQTEIELKKSNDELKLISSRDGLTGIANRRYHDEYLAHEWERMAREKSPLSLLMCDIDYFKRYNDAYGHLEGDECLKVIAGVIAGACKRPADIAARYGGEEFTVILPGTDLEGAALVAESIRSGIEKLGIEHYDSESGIVTVSIGIASVIPLHGGDPGALTLEADRALYRAKSSGRNRIERG